MTSETEPERVTRVMAETFRSWLVANDAAGSPLVPVQWLRDRLHDLREGYPFDGRTVRARGYSAALVDIDRLLDRAVQAQQLDHPNPEETR